MRRSSNASIDTLEFVLTGPFGADVDLIGDFPESPHEFHRLADHTHASEFWNLKSSSLWFTEAAERGLAAG